jgi:plasmid stabilization system protein ParE
LAGAARTSLKRIRWTPIAFDDLRAISVYIERQRSLATANKVSRGIHDAIQTLRRFPERGKIGIEHGTRELVVPGLPYTVTYRLVRSEAIEILRIWHGAQERHEET